MTWRNPANRSLLPLSAGFLLLLVAASASVLLSVRQEQAAMEVRRMLDFAGRLSGIRIALTDAETGQSGYLLTGRRTYLTPYENARSTLSDELDQLGAELPPGPVATALFARLRRLTADKLAELQRTIVLRSADRTDEALAIVNDDSGSLSMSGIRQAVGDLQAMATTLADARSARLNRLDLITRFTLLASVAIVIVLGVAALMGARRRMAGVAAANVRLVAEVKERQAAEAQVRQLQKMQAIGQLAGGIAHDFNNMLTIVISSLELARRRIARVGPDQAMRFLDNAAEGANRAAVLTARLLAFSRQQALEPQAIDANKLVAGMSELLRRTIGESVKIETVLAGGLWRTSADPMQLESALLNLAVNARDAMPSGGKLTIETGNTHLDERYAAEHTEVAAGQYVLLSVTDTGTGMPPEVIERAFEPFYTTKRVGEGTGLGLSQVFGFVKQSGGHVKIYSEVGRGTTVKIYLPRLHTDAEPMPLPQRQDPARGSETGVILVVEDDDKVKLATAALLNELGYTVITAGSPREALEVLERDTSVTLLLTDIVMPDMTGRELAERAVALRPGLAVLYTTGYTRNAIVHSGIIDPGTVLVSKPFTLEQLSFKVRQVLGRRG